MRKIAVLLRIAGWDLQTGEELWRISSHKGWINTIVMTPDEQSVISGGCGLRNDEDLCIRDDAIEYDIASGAAIKVHELHTDSITALAYDPTYTYLLIGTADGV